MPDFNFKAGSFPMASVIQAAQQNNALQQQAREDGQNKLLQGLQSIGQIGQSLVDKRLKVAQALALGGQYGIPADQARLMDPDQILKVAAINKGGVDMQMLFSLLHGTGPQAAKGGDATTEATPAGVSPAPAAPTNPLMLTGGLETSTPPGAPASPPPIAAPPAMPGLAPAPAPAAATMPVPIAPPPSKPVMVNKATADMAYKINAATQPQNVIQYTPGKGLQVVGTKRKGDQVITSQMNPGLTASWETATPQQQALAKAMYEGRVRPSDLSFRERGVTTTLANEYANMNGLTPFKAYNADVNATMAKFATSGKLGQNALSLNTALGHLSSAYDSYQNIQNTDQAWLNKPMNWLKKNTNDPNVVALGINLNALQGELATVFKNSGATDQEISHWKDYLNDQLTPAQYIGAASKIDELLRSRLSAMEFQQSRAGGGNGPLISPHAQEISTKLGNNQAPSQAPPNSQWNNTNEQRLQILLEKQKKGTLRS